MSLRRGGSTENMTTVGTNNVALVKALGYDIATIRDGMKNSVIRTDTVPNEFWLDKDLELIRSYRNTDTYPEAPIAISRLVRFLNLLQGKEQDTTELVTLWVYYLTMSPSFWDRNNGARCLACKDSDEEFKIPESFDHYAIEDLIQASASHNHKPDQAASQTVTVKLDNREFVAWASTHLEDHYSFMGYYCFLLFRAYSKSKESTLTHLTKKGLAQAGQFVESQLPEVFPHFDGDSQAFVQGIFRINYESYRRVLKMVIVSLLNEERNGKKEQLFDYCIKVPLAYIGLHTVKLLSEAFKDQLKLIEMHELVANTHNDELERQFSEVLNVIMTQGLLRMKQTAFLQRNPALVGQTSNYLPYCRVLETRYHGELSGPRNQALICYAVGLKGQNAEVLNKIWCVKNYPDVDKNTFYQLGLDHRRLALPKTSRSTGASRPEVRQTTSLDTPRQDESELLKELDAFENQ